MNASPRDLADRMELEKALTRQIAAAEAVGENGWVDDLLWFKTRCVARRVALEAEIATKAATRVAKERGQ